MFPGALFGLVSTLVTLGLIAFAVTAAVRAARSPDREGDAAVSVRRLFVYVLLLIALGISAAGAQALLELVLDTRATLVGDSSRQARGLASLLVGLPSYILLLRYLLRRLASDHHEERSFGWRFYMNVTMASALITAMVGGTGVTRTILGGDAFNPASAAWAIVATAVWAFHWFGPPARHFPEGGLPLMLGSVAGLATLIAGMVQLLATFGDAITSAVGAGVLAGSSIPERVGGAAALLVVGGAVWWWHWLRPERRRWDDMLWQTYVMVAGVLTGVLMLIGSAAVVIGQTLIWFFGDPAAAAAGAHFDFLPGTIATGVTGAAVWAYHASANDRAARIEPTRVYEYIVAGVGLIATASGNTILLVAFIQVVAPRAAVESNVNTLLGAVTALIVGGPLWWVYWSRAERHRAARPAVEVASPSRRIYTAAVLGLSALIALVSLIIVLFIVLEDLFEGVLSGDTLLDIRVPLALVITTGLVGWYHSTVYRADRAVTVEPSAPVRKRIVLLGPPDGDLAAALAAHEGFTVRQWARTDAAGAWTGAVDELVDRIAAVADEDVLVIVGDDRPTVIPYRPG